MKNEGYAELFSWNIDKVEEASLKVLAWYNYAFSKLDKFNWDVVVVRELLPILRKKISPHPVLFRSDGFDLLFRPSDMVYDIAEVHRNMSMGVEVDPQFVFIEEPGRLTPRERTSFLRANQDIGTEAEEVLGALYNRFPPTIVLPRTNFANKIYKGNVGLFDKILLNYPK